MTTPIPTTVELLAREIVFVPIDSIEPHPENPNQGDPDAIGESVDAVGGFYQVVFVQRSSGRIIVGEHRWRTLRNRGSLDAPVVFLDVDDDTAMRIMVGDNEIPRQRSTPKDAALVAALRHLRATPQGLAGTGYDDALLRQAARRLGAGGGGGGQADDVPTVPGEPRTQRGDLWLCGRHRVLCGDSFADDDVARALGDLAPAMVLTDPPYAVYGSSTGIGADIADDKMVRPFFLALGRRIMGTLPEFGHAYVHCDWRSYPTLWDAFKAAGLSPKNCLVWDKGGSGLGANYANSHEFVAFFSRLPPEKAMTASRKAGQRTVAASNILRFSRPHGDDREHNAAKPVAMLAELIANSSDDGDVVVDYFGGSGSTLIAADDTNRTAVVVEMEPRWVDTIVARWERHTGGTATLAEP